MRDTRSPFQRLMALAKQLVKFSLVGLLNTGLDFLIFSLLTLSAFFAQNPVLAHILSYSCGVVCSLILNKVWTFRYKGRMSGGQLGLFLLVNLVALAVSSGAIALLEGVLSLAPLLAKALSLPFSMGVNFLGNKLFVFRQGGR